MPTLYDIPVTTIDGRERSMADFRGQVLLVVNVASQCGFTPQYAGLEALYQKCRDRGFVILGCPCDQFNHQEPGDNAEISSFCSVNYGVTFPLLSKLSVNGAATHPLYRHLKAAKRGLLGIQAIKWNFSKFLIDRQGKVVKRYGPLTTPQRIERDVVKLL
jgi:glutathione peroxidase